MMTKQFNWMITLTLLTALLISACQKEDIGGIDAISNFSEIDLRDDEETNGNKCYEYTFPITLILEGEVEEVIESKEALIEFASNYREDNPVSKKPRIKLPAEITLGNGEVVNVETGMQLLKIKRACKKKRARGFVLRHCFDLIYPVTVNYPNGDAVSYETEEAHLAALKTWREDNPDATERPKIGLPQDVELPDGTVITIENAEQFKELGKQCIEDRPHGPCFKLIFPITIDFPDGTSSIVADLASMKNAFRDWKEANPDAADRPEISFPHDVLLPNGNTVTLENAEDAKELFMSCRQKRAFPSIIDNGCFSLNFPVDFKAPNGDTVEVASLEDLKVLIEEVPNRPKNHKVRNYPRIMVPFDVTLKSDESVLTIESFDDLKELFADCAGG